MRPHYLWRATVCMCVMSTPCRAPFTQGRSGKANREESEQCDATCFVGREGTVTDRP
jgi:hypothetical protein